MKRRNCFVFRKPWLTPTLLLRIQTKLESYRAIQAGGKELSADQAAAVAKYDSVLATLEFARDFSKQTQQMFKEAEKEQKKQARKVRWVIPNWRKWM